MASTPASAPLSGMSSTSSSSDAIILLPALSAETWHKALSQTDVRDKFFRLLQYLCRFIRGVQFGRQTPPSETAVGRLQSLESALASSRQLWRLLKWLSVYAVAKPRARNSLSSIPRPAVSDITAIVADSSLFMYLLLDNIAFIHKARILNGDVGLATRRAARFWLAAVLASLGGSIVQAISLRRSTARIAGALKDAREARAMKANDDAEGEGTTGSINEREYSETDIEARKQLAIMAKKYNVASAVVARHAADAVVAFSLSRHSPLHPALVGACGALSSAIALWQVWPRGQVPQPVSAPPPSSSTERES